MDDPYREGVEAFAAGLPITANPHHPRRERTAYYEYSDGWERASFARALSVLPPRPAYLDRSGARPRRATA